MRSFQTIPEQLESHSIGNNVEYDSFGECGWKVKCNRDDGSLDLEGYVNMNQWL